MATKGKKNTISVDFSNVESSGVPDEGDYVLEVDEVEQKTSDNSGNDYLSITFKITEGKFKGKKVWHNCSLQPQALFNLRGLLEALGFDVSTGKFEFDPADMVGESCGASLAHETYNGKVKARPVEFFSSDDVEESAEEEKPVAKAAAKPAPKVEEPETPAETPAPKAKKKKPAAPADGFSVGDTVSFVDDEGNDLKGTITAIEDGAYTVTTGVGKKAEEWELEESDLVKA
jgi:hypothetical protein